MMMSSINKVPSNLISGSAKSRYLPLLTMCLPTFACSLYLSLNSLYGGGGSSSGAEEVLAPLITPVLMGFWSTRSIFRISGAVGTSRWDKSNLRKACLFFHCCWLAAKS